MVFIICYFPCSPYKCEGVSSLSPSLPLPLHHSLSTPTLSLVSLETKTVKNDFLKNDVMLYYEETLYPIALVLSCCHVVILPPRVFIDIFGGYYVKASELGVRGVNLVEWNWE
jgi:hypothetical protein